jgi:hypothetical protein
MRIKSVPPLFYDKEKTLPVHKGIKVHNQEQYDEVVLKLDNMHSVANKPKVDKKGLIELDAFPFIVQYSWLPVCGYFISVRHKSLTNLNYVDFCTL